MSQICVSECVETMLSSSKFQRILFLVGFLKMDCFAMQTETVRKPEEGEEVATRDYRSYFFSRGGGILFHFSFVFKERKTG